MRTLIQTSGPRSFFRPQAVTTEPTVNRPTISRPFERKTTKSLLLGYVACSLWTHLQRYTLPKERPNVQRKSLRQHQKKQKAERYKTSRRHQPRASLMSVVWRARRDLGHLFRRDLV